MPREDELTSLYPADYHSLGRSGRLTKIRYDMRVSGIRALKLGDGAVLDYGCGDGSFLVQAASSMPGRKFFGYEIADRSDVQELAGGAVTLVRGTPEHLLELLPACRLIMMNHVIEHLPTPLQTVQRLVAKLAPGGIFEGQTPAAGSLEHRVFGSRWSGYHAPRHTVVFSRKGLRRLLERAGLEKVDVRGAFNPAALAVSLGSMTQRENVPGRITRHGFSWLIWLGLAAVLAPIDLFSGSPGIVNFAGTRSAAS
jgi:SAM-dependent methyltransferase